VDRKKGTELFKKMELRIKEGRKLGQVLEWGELPCTQESRRQGRGFYFVPNGFVVKTFSHGYEWVGQTRVTFTNNVPRAEYRFHLFGYENVCSNWHPNPTRAYREVNERIGNPKFRKNANGALIIGVSYPNVQIEIISRLPLDVNEQVAGLQVNEQELVVPQAFENEQELIVPLAFENEQELFVPLAFENQLNSNSDTPEDQTSHQISQLLILFETEFRNEDLTDFSEI